jgi:hypothetical protein
MVYRGLMKGQNASPSRAAAMTSLSLVTQNLLTSHPSGVYIHSPRMTTARKLE